MNGVRLSFIVACLPLFDAHLTKEASGQCVPAWTDLAGGVNQKIFTFCTYEYDVDGQHIPTLYAGGNYTSPTYLIGAWNGIWWTAIPNTHSQDGAVYALTVFDDDGAGPHRPELIIGGDFTQLGGVPAQSCIRWNGISFSAMANSVSGGPGTVKAMAVFDEDGSGPGLPTLITNTLRRWNGTAWSSIGASANGVRNAMIVWDPDGPGPAKPLLVFGGQFSQIGGVTANNVAAWDGSSWFALNGPGNGVDGIVTSLAVFDDDGDGPILPALYAAGWFINAGGVLVNRIAKFDGTNWSALIGPGGSGVDNFVNSLAVMDEDGPGPIRPGLFVGGDFLSAGGVSVGEVAKWDGATWSALTGPSGNGISGSSGPVVTAIYAHDEDGPGAKYPALYVAGSFTNAGGVTVRNAAKWGRTFPAGDGNLSGGADGLDLQPFVDACLNPLPSASQLCAYDLNVDGMIDDSDVPLLLSAILNS